MPGPKRPSMADVARAAGVSAQTVSRVANGEPYVSDAKRARVLQVMRELGYRPNSAARAMKRGAFKTIGVVFHSLHPVGNHRTLEAISEVAATRGYATTLIPLEATTHRAADGAFTRLGEMTVDAAIAIIPSHFVGDSTLHLPVGVPLVVLGPSLDMNAASVDFDQEVGTREAVRHLLGLGHRTVHHVAGPAESYSAVGRERAWRSVLTEQGRPVPPVVTGDWSPDSGYRATRDLLEHERPTALFVANDQMALGAFRALLEAGLRVPEDVSVIGFDNIDEAVAFPTPLTTVAQDWEKVGHEALRAALDMIAGGPPTTSSLPTRLVVRESTGPAPHR
ncbi:LacI family DNA-binding transcriptional regulator [Actinomyces polynesiensis]|uniref:LacI family DNA-binding transcriptional regulator n=1 Tax=Actinomyces polynesiensis TaxID=1325934 RepID=UPI000A73DA98|nr:LacI family DNA-binding transcriptional regulator [Actinomyces polynesiensis]